MLGCWCTVQGGGAKILQWRVDLKQNKRNTVSEAVLALLVRHPRLLMLQLAISPACQCRVWAAGQSISRGSAWSPHRSSCGTWGQSLAVVQGRADPRPPQGPRYVEGRRTRCHTLGGRGGAPAGSGRSPFGCRTTLMGNKDGAEERNNENLFDLQTKFNIIKIWPNKWLKGN